MTTQTKTLIKLALIYVAVICVLVALCSCGISKKAKKAEVIDYSKAVMVDSSHRVASISFNQDSTKTEIKQDSSYERVTTDIFEYSYVYDSSAHNKPEDYFTHQLVKHTREVKEKGNKQTQTTTQADKKESLSKVDSTGKHSTDETKFKKSVKDKTKSSNTIPLWIVILIIGLLVAYFGGSYLKQHFNL